MLLNSVIIILREVLEASLLISLMLSVSQTLRISRSWLKWSFMLGLFGAFIYAKNITPISESLEGVGQEVFNASLQYLIYILLAGFCIWLVNLENLKVVSRPILKRASWVMIICISLSMIREFSEIMIYLQAFSWSNGNAASVYLGAFIGLGIGISASVIFYYLLNYLNDRMSNHVVIIILAFLASGMLLQATQLLIQADWLPSQSPLWDISTWLPERSIMGQLLYAVFGYEASPSPIEVGIYLSGLSVIFVFILRRFWLHTAVNGEQQKEVPL